MFKSLKVVQKVKCLINLININKNLNFRSKLLKIIIFFFDHFFLFLSPDPFESGTSKKYVIEDICLSRNGKNNVIQEMHFPSCKNVKTVSEKKNERSLEKQRRARRTFKQKRYDLMAPCVGIKWWNLVFLFKNVSLMIHILIFY